MFATEAKAWLNMAMRDLGHAESVVTTFPHQAAFSVQQAVEKALKAMVVSTGQRPPRTHDLALLRAAPPWVTRWPGPSMPPGSTA